MDIAHDPRLPLFSTHTFPGLSGTASQARDCAALFLARCDPMAATAAGDVLLLVSELVSNAVRHAPGACTLDLVQDGTQLTIAVTDTHTQRPRPRAPDLAAGGGGFGWHLLANLAAHLHVVPIPAGGKTVVATVLCRTQDSLA